MFPSDEALDKAVDSYINGRTATTPFQPGRRTRTRIRNVLTAAYAIDEPIIREEEAERWQEALRYYEQTLRGYERDESKIRSAALAGFIAQGEIPIRIEGGVSDLMLLEARNDQTRRIVEALREYEREDLAGIHVVLPADFIERKFGV